MDSDSVPGHSWVALSLMQQGACCGVVNRVCHGPYMLGYWQDRRVQINEPCGQNLGKQPSASS